MNFDIFFIAFNQSFWLVIATLLPALNPVAISVFFLALTEGASQQIRRSMATRIAIQVTLLMVFFMLVGSHILALFSLSIDIVKLGGGLLLAMIGWNMINTKSGEEPATKSAQALTPETANLLCFYPLTFPLSFGPGTLVATITISVTLVNNSSPAMVAVNLIGATVGCLASGTILLVCCRYAEKLLKPLGKTGSMIFLHFSAFILLCLGIQVAWGGLRSLISDVIGQGVA